MRENYKTALQVSVRTNLNISGKSQCYEFTSDTGTVLGSVLTHSLDLDSLQFTIA